MEVHQESSRAPLCCSTLPEHRLQAEGSCSSMLSACCSCRVESSSCPGAELFKSKGIKSSPTLSAQGAGQLSTARHGHTAHPGSPHPSLTGHQGSGTAGRAGTLRSCGPSRELLLVFTGAELHTGVLDQGRETQPCTQRSRGWRGNPTS